MGVQKYTSIVVPSEHPGERPQRQAGAPMPRFEKRRILFAQLIEFQIYQKFSISSCKGRSALPLSICAVKGIHVLVKRRMTRMPVGLLSTSCCK